MALTRSLLIGALLLTAFPWAAWAQAPFPAGRPVAGSIQCRIQTTGGGYSESQVHTWTIAGAAPTTTNAADGTLWIHQAQWSANGKGTSQQPWGTNGTVSEQWSLAAGPMDAAIAIRARVSDLAVELWHSPIQVTEGASGFTSRFGYQTSPNPVPWKDALREAPLVAITSARTAATISGTSSVTLASYVTHGQPAGSAVVETCTWQLAPAASSSTLPPPPPSSSGATGTIAPEAFTPPVVTAVMAPVTLGTSPADGPWSGQAQCVLTAQGANYQDEQTHTWRITGGPPKMNGMFRQWPAVWSVRGNGGRRVGTPIAAAGGSGGQQEGWTYDVRDISAPIAISEAPGGRIRFGSQHGLIVANAGLTIRALTPGTGNTSAATIQEWMFPVVEDTAANTTITGTRTRTVPQTAGWRQPSSVMTTETCTWNFTRGASAPPSDDLSRLVLPTPTVSGRRGEATAPSSPQPSAPAPASPTQTTAVRLPGTDAVFGTTGDTTGGATINPTRVACSTTGPTLTTAATPGGVTFKWPAMSGATGYSLSRRDIGVLTGTPITALTYTQSAALDYHNSYQYAVTAWLSDGKCATSSVTVTPPKPITPQVTLKLTPGAQTSTVNLTWPDQSDAPTSYLVLGPGLHEAGAEVTASRSGQSLAITNVASGSQTWLVMPVWKTSAGIMSDVATAARVTATAANTGGTYAIYIAGFRVNSQTYDNQLNTDGWLDEIYAAAAVTKWESGVVKTNDVIRGAIHGDANQPNFVRAGNGSATGGLRSGDSVPSGWGPNQPLAPEPIATRFPIKLWEGTLRSSIDVVAVRPTLWEFDGEVWGYEFWKQWVLKYPNAGDGLKAPGLVAARGAQTPLYQFVTAAQYASLDETMDAATFAAIGKPKLQTDFRYDGYGLPVNAQRFYPGKDRIIGLDSYVKDMRGLFIDVTKPNLGSTQEFDFSRMHWVDRQVAFTKDKIETALNSPASDGLAPGTVAISLVDKDLNPAGPLHGDYTLYLRVIRVP